MTEIVVVGGGQAGASLVARLRKAGYDGGLTLVCGEPVPPYQRPPLSKAYLLGEMDRARLYLRPPSFYAEHRIELILGETVTGIDRRARQILLGDTLLTYDKLALTTGSQPRRLPEAMGGALAGVHTVRGLADVDAMAEQFAPGRRALVVGGGYIGLEAAAVAAKSGVAVTLVEMAPRILQRVAAPETADFFRALHREHGVDLREGLGLTRLVAAEGGARVGGAEFADGSRIEVDFVLVGIGIAPDTALAEAAGLQVDNGIVVDEQARTSDHAIWAAGDCAAFPRSGAMIRLESVQNAIDQGELAADNMLGAGRTYDPHPWFWSDQYDVKLQIAGLNTGYDRVVRREAEGTSLWYFRGEELLAVDAMNAPRAYMIGKRLIEAGRSPAPEVLADPASDLKALLKP